MWWVFLKSVSFQWREDCSHFKERYTKKCKKKETSKRHAGRVHKRIFAKKSKNVLGGHTFSVSNWDFMWMQIQTTFTKMYQISFSIIQLSPCCCHISFLLFLVHPAPPLPTRGFTASFVQTSQRFRTCQNQEGRLTIKRKRSCRWFSIPNVCSR